MPVLRIPDRHRPAFARLRTLDRETVNALAARLGKLGPSVSPLQVVEAVAQVLPHWERPEAERLGQALISLYAVRVNSGDPLELFVERFCDALQAGDVAEPISDQERVDFKDRLLVLLGVSTFADVVKARDLQTEHERVFCDARIFTDLRPVFGPNLEEGPHAMVVVHMLRIGFHLGTEKHHQFYVAMDSEDIVTLRGLLERAESKSRSLKKSVEKGGAQFLDL